MAHRCRTCAEAHFAERSGIAYPRPEELAALDPFMPQLLEAAREFTSFGSGNALEFAEWLAIECRQHAASFARVRGTG